MLAGTPTSAGALSRKPCPDLISSHIDIYFSIFIEISKPFRQLLPHPSLIYSLKNLNMKKMIFVSLIAFVAISCNQKSENAATAESATAETATAAKVPLAFQPTYSSSFEIGNPAYAAMIVQGSWKDWQDNTMDSMQKWVADTVVALQSDNTMVRGVDSLLAMVVGRCRVFCNLTNDVRKTKHHDYSQKLEYELVADRKSGKMSADRLKAI